MSQKAEIKKQKRYAATQRSMSKKFFNHETAQAKSKPRCKKWVEEPATDEFIDFCMAIYDACGVNSKLTEHDIEIIKVLMRK